jgi:hypothetical protein
LDTLKSRTGDGKQAAQYPAATVPTNTTKPVNVRYANKLEQNTLLGRFSGHKSEAK